MRRLVVYEWADDLAGRIRDERKVKGRLQRIVDALFGKRRKRRRIVLDEDEAGWTPVEIRFAEPVRERHDDGGWKTT